MSFVLPVLFSAAAVAAGQPASPAAPRPDASQNPSSAELGPGQVAWAASFQEAQERAVREGKLVFFEFTREECGNCKRMDSLLYPAVEFDALLASFVPVKVSLDGPVGQEVAARYGIKEVPSILATTPDGRLVFLMEGFHNQGDFFRKANSGLAAYRKLAQRLEAQDVTKLSAKEALATGGELYHRSDPQAALPRLKRASTAPGSTAREREDALELLAAAELDLGHPAGARKTIEQLLSATKDRERRERAELFRAQIPLAENKPAEALALFKKFQKDHPASPHLARVNDLVVRLEERLSQP